MTIREIQDEIQRLKRELGVCILAHSYQTHDILEIADYVGDSFALSKDAARSEAKTVMMCGVQFMAETVKLLSPEKTVLMPNTDAGCAMADMIDKNRLSEIRSEYPDYTVVAYINTSAAVKTISDVCVTSSSALKIVQGIDNDNILFIPDCNLGGYVAEQLPEKNIKLIDGCCPVHASVTAATVEKAKSAHPCAELLVHPECRAEVLRYADYIGSTAGIMEYAKSSSCSEFIIGTETTIAEHLQYECTDKRFYPLTQDLICASMRQTTLIDVLNCLRGKGGKEIELDRDTLKKARKPIDEMLRLG